MSEPRASSTRPLLLMFGATLCFVTMVAGVKLASSELTSFEIIFFRSVIALPVMAALCVPIGFRIVNRGGMVLRCVVGFAAMALTFFVAEKLALADLSIIGRLQPVLLAVVAPLFLGQGEKQPKSIWLAMLLGFAGAMVLVRPSFDVVSIYAILAIVAACGRAMAHLMIRWLGRTDAARIQVFWFQASLMPLAFGAQYVFFSEVVSLPTTRDGIIGALMCGVFATGGQLLMTKAYALESAPKVAAVSYMAPLLAAGYDILVFAIIPGWPTLIGATLVLASGWLLWASRNAQ